MAKTEQQRGPIGSWMRRERLAHGWTTADVVNRLKARQAPILESSYRGYEAGPRPPSEQIIRALEAVFGSEAPDTTKEAVEPVTLDSLVGAIAAQTEAINRLADALAGQTTSPVTLLESLSADELRQWQERIANKLAVLPTRSDEGSVDPPDTAAQDEAAREGQGLS